MKYFIFLFSFLFFLIFNIESYSLPRFATKLRKKCIDCHYNPTGGLMRNDNGFYYGQNILSMISPRSDEFKMSPKLNDNISIGMDLRGQFLYSQEKNRTDFQRMEGSIYTNINLSKKINILTKYDFVNRNWEAFGVARILPNNSYIKGGSFKPNYGIRLDDHTAYTRGGDFGLLYTTGARQGLIYDPLYLEAGMEIGVYVSKFMFITASAGSNLYNRTLTKDPSYTARVEVTPSIGRIGLLFGGSYATASIPGRTNFYGGFAGIGYDRFALLGEFDRANDLRAPNLKSNVYMIQTSYVILEGLEAIARYDRFEPDITTSKDNVAHLIVGFEFIPYSFIEIRPQYRFIIENPSVNNDAVVLQMHIWY